MGAWRQRRISIDWRLVAQLVLPLVTMRMLQDDGTAVYALTTLRTTDTRCRCPSLNSVTTIGSIR